ncbi:MAG: response regulator [Candidatus Hodarchaeota archaeon]
MNKKERILVINDNNRLLKQLVRYLSYKGYDIEGTEFGKEGVNLFRKKKFNLVIIDYHLENDKHKTAEFFIHKMKAINSSIPIIVMSATEENLIASDLNASDFIYLDLEKNFAEEISNCIENNLINNKIYS